MLFTEEPIKKTNLFVSQDKDSQIKFFTDNMVNHVYLQDDVIVKQGDIAGPDEYFYIVIEGLAEVILEKRDFCFYSLDSIEMFLKGKGSTIEVKDAV